MYDMGHHISYVMKYDLIFLYDVVTLLCGVHDIFFF